ncbi:MAG: hypothetical protein J6W69_04640 [Bacteroidales bacterium]|nr:hypothetical protein [Bacteroidales bacterium]
MAHYDEDTDWNDPMNYYEEKDEGCLIPVISIGIGALLFLLLFTCGA